MFAGTLTASISICRSTHICCFHFFLEKVKGAQIFPAVFWFPHNLVRIRFVRSPKFLHTAGKRVTGADVSPTAQGDDPLEDPRFAGAELGAACGSAAIAGEHNLGTAIQNVPQAHFTFPAGKHFTAASAVANVGAI